MYVFLELGAYALGIAHFACTIVLLIRWAILRTARTRGRIIRPDMHKYVSVRYPMSFKILALFVIGGYVLVVFPAGVYAIASVIIEEIGQDINPLIPAGIAAGIGLLILIAIARAPMCHKEVSATVDSRGLTIEYKDGERTTIGVRGYKGYIGETKKHAFRLVYEGEDGKDLLTDAIKADWAKAILESGSASPDAITGATLTYSAGSVQEAMTEILAKIDGE